MPLARLSTGILVSLINHRSVLSVRNPSDESYLLTYLVTYLLSYLVRQNAVRYSHDTFFQMLAVVYMNGLLSCNIIY